MTEGWSRVQARSAKEYFEDEFGMDMKIDSEEVNKTKELFEKYGAVKRVQGEMIYLENIHNQLRIWRRAVKWYKIFTDKNPAFLHFQARQSHSRLLDKNTSRPFLRNVTKQKSINMEFSIFLFQIVYNDPVKIGYIYCLTLFKKKIRTQNLDLTRF